MHAQAASQTPAPATKPSARAASASATATATTATASRAPGTVLAPHLRHDALGKRLLACRRERTGAREPLVQREVRVGGGRKKVDERKYLPGGPRENVGSRHSVAALIGDDLPRVFVSETELERYANGQTDYIGDVETKEAGMFWYRLPPQALTVLGETHAGPDGNVEDVLRAFGTARFMYEPFNAMQPLAASTVDFAGTGGRMAELNTRIAPGHASDPAFEPALEHIVFKAVTGTTIFNEFVSHGPRTMGAPARQEWGARPTNLDWSYGERCALYVSMAIHIAQDIAAHDFGPAVPGEPPLVLRSRELKALFERNRKVLEAFIQAKDADELIGIYELTSTTGFKNLHVLMAFSSMFQDYAAQFIRALGAEKHNAKLEREGAWLASHKDAKLEQISPAREEIMWERVMFARSHRYLLVGMGDRHRESLQPRLDAESIKHVTIDEDLERQADAIARAWVP